jgi:hypothetical protein
MANISDYSAHEVGVLWLVRYKIYEGLWTE